MFLFFQTLFLLEVLHQLDTMYIKELVCELKPLMKIQKT